MEDRISDLCANDRHELEPIPVLPMDTADGADHIQLRDSGTGNNRSGSLRDRRTSRQTFEQSWPSMLVKTGANSMAKLQGKWNFRAKRKGDLLAEY